MPRSSRLRMLLPLALTAAALAGTADLSRTRSAHADSGCNNTECEGIVSCRYARGVKCSFSASGTSCTNSDCARQVEP